MLNNQLKGQDNPKKKEEREGSQCSSPSTTFGMKIKANKITLSSKGA